MPRTDQDSVAEIREVEEGDDLTPFIDVAYMLVNAVCVYKDDGTPFGYTDDELKKIETWLAAHFYTIYSPRAFLEQVDTIREQIESKVDLKLDVTRYGQQAMIIDYHGGLAALNNGLKAVQKKFPGATGRERSIKWLGSKDNDPAYNGGW